MAEVTLITGGARSGKSAEALRLAEEFDDRVFIATAEAVDDEMRERIARHREERGEGWKTIEEPFHLADAVRKASHPGAALVVDCLTVWIGNQMHRDPTSNEDAVHITEFVEALRGSRAERIVVVTNEVGMGIVPHNDLSRHYRDVTGQLNQRVAAIADRVILMVCGKALAIK